MGKAARTKSRDERRQAGQRTRPSEATNTAGLQAERRGRRVAPTPQAYLRASRRWGPESVVEAVLSLGNQRMLGMVRSAEKIGPSVAGVHALAPVIDAALVWCGAKFEAVPSASEDLATRWKQHLVVCADRQFHVTRLRLCGQHVGAAVVARLQLERMTSNRAYTFGVERREGEEYQSWASRVWANSDGSADGGASWSALSEIIHGRAGSADVALWESCAFVGPAPPSWSAVDGAIASAQVLAARQLRGMVATIAEATDTEWIADVMSRGVDVGAAELPRFLGPLLWPMTYGLAGHGDHAGYLNGLGRRYWDLLSEAPGSSRWPELAGLAFAERRSRAAQRALASRKQEETLLGPVDDGDAMDRLVPLLVAAEVAGLGARWAREPNASAMAVAATALRSAVLLWLEDENAAMGALRTVLEQVARSRTFRMKPNKAARLVDSSFDGPHRWIEAAGLRRLSILNRCLGEFAHHFEQSRWDGALEGLRKLQTPESRAQHDGLYTARGHALDVTSLFLLEEALEVVGMTSAPLQQVLAGALEPFRPVRPEAAMEHVLERALVLSGMDMGQPGFERFTDADEVEVFGADAAARLRQFRAARHS